MFGQLNNQLPYKPLQSDPTPKHLALVESWCSKWLGKGEISPKVVKWGLNKEARPGVAFGSIKTHKMGNPLRLLLHLVVARQLKTYRPLLNFIYIHFLKNYHGLLRTPLICLTKYYILTQAAPFQPAPYWSRGSWFQCLLTLITNSPSLQ